MNKVICDVCGTDYPETAAQCPICGCARGEGNQTSAGNTENGEEERTYTYVKGGRFSKSNVRKRLKASQAEQARKPEPEPEYDDEDEEDENEEEEEGGSNLGLIAIVVLLLLAIIAVSSYIAIVHFGLFDQADPTNPSTSATTPSRTDPTESTGVRVPCTGLTMTDSEITLSAVDSVWTLNYSVEPLDTTDAIKFESADPSVAVVDATGRVTAVGAGETTITATCGSFSMECKVVCDFEDTTTKPTDPSDPTDPTDPVVTVELKLNRTDFTLSRKGESWNVYSGELDPADITWTSGNEAIVTVENGKVVAVGPGRTRIFAEYEGQKVSCWVSCSFPAEEPTEPTDPTEPSDPADPTDPTDPVEPEKTYTLMVNGAVSPFGDANNASVTLAVGESFRLTVENEMAAFQQVEWSMSKADIVSYESNKVTGLAKGTVTLTAEYEGQTFTCIVYVTEPTA